MNPFFDVDLDRWLDSYSPHNKLWAWFLKKCEEIEGYVPVVKEMDQPWPPLKHEPLVTQLLRTVSQQEEHTEGFNPMKLSQQDSTLESMKDE